MANLNNFTTDEQLILFLYCENISLSNLVTVLNSKVTQDNLRQMLAVSIAIDIRQLGDDKAKKLIENERNRHEEGRKAAFNKFTNPNK